MTHEILWTIAHLWKRIIIDLYKYTIHIQISTSCWERTQKVGINGMNKFGWKPLIWVFIWNLHYWRQKHRYSSASQFICNNQVLKHGLKHHKSLIVSIWFVGWLTQTSPSHMPSQKTITEKMQDSQGCSSIASIRKFKGWTLLLISKSCKSI